MKRSGTVAGADDGSGLLTERHVRTYVSASARRRLPPVPADLSPVPPGPTCPTGCEGRSPRAAAACRDGQRRDAAARRAAQGDASPRQARTDTGRWPRRRPTRWEQTDTGAGPVPAARVGGEGGSEQEAGTDRHCGRPGPTARWVTREGAGRRQARHAAGDKPCRDAASGPGPASR